MGELDPWICAWQITHPRPVILFAFDEFSMVYSLYTVGGCRDVTWQRWQRNGTLATSMRSLLDPCGSWQVVQELLTGACSQSNGPRFSLWQLVQAWSIVVPARSSFTLAEPCVLWQDEHTSLSSRTGIWLNRLSLLTMF